MKEGKKMDQKIEKKKHIVKKNKTLNILHKALSAGGLDYTDKKKILSIYENVTRQRSQLKKTL